MLVLTMLEEVPDEFWLTQAQWHEELWETRNLLDSFPLPHLFFHHQDGLFQWFISSPDSESVQEFEVREFLWSSLPDKKTFYMLKYLHVSIQSNLVESFLVCF